MTSILQMKFKTCLEEIGNSSFKHSVQGRPMMKAFCPGFNSCWEMSSLIPPKRYAGKEICDMICSMEAKVGKCETEIRAKIGSKKTKKYNTNINNFVTDE